MLRNFDCIELKIEQLKNETQAAIMVQLQEAQLI